MTRRGSARILTLGGAALLLLGAACSREGEQSGPPAVLLVTIDALRPDYLSFNGYDRPTSPFLDELFALGFYFDRAVSPIARTTPALASLLTGAYPHRSGVRRLTDSLSDDVVTLAEVLRDHGYQTLAVVSNTILHRVRRLGRGFDVYDYRGNVRTASQTTEAVLTQLEVIDRSRPLFAWVHFFDPHVPYHPLPDTAEAFDPDYTGPYALGFGRQPRDGEPRSLLRGFPEDLTKSLATHRNPLPDDVNAHVRRLYAADIRDTDAAVRGLVEGFLRIYAGRLLVVVTADHGESLGEHDFFFDHGDYAYNAGTRVPLAFVLPDGHPDQGSGRCSEWVSLVDVAPTLLELLGIGPGAPLDAQLEGRSLTPCLRGEELPQRAVFAESGLSWYPELVPRRRRNDVEGRFRAVTLGDFKLIWTPFAEGGDAWELYDVRRDPHETRNLYRRDHPQRRGLEEALRAWLERAKPMVGPAPISEADRARLRELGYTE